MDIDDAEIRCPRCKRIAMRQPTHILEWYDRDFKCKTKGCLYVGLLHWVKDDKQDGISNAKQRTNAHPKMALRTTAQESARATGKRSYTKSGKPRKARSDAGQARGAYGPRTK